MESINDINLWRVANTRDPNQRKKSLKTQNNRQALEALDPLKMKDKYI